jgi:hypothetical protein
MMAHGRFKHHTAAGNPGIVGVEFRSFVANLALNDGIQPEIMGCNL